MSRYIKFFVFAEKYGITELADKTTIGLVGVMKTKKLTYVPPSTITAKVYSLTHAASKLRIPISRCAAYIIFNREEEATKLNWSKAKVASSNLGKS